jgi:hypothetical protein
MLLPYAVMTSGGLACVCVYRGDGVRIDAFITYESDRGKWSVSSSVFGSMG